MQLNFLSAQISKWRNKRKRWYLLWNKTIHHGIDQQPPCLMPLNNNTSLMSFTLNYSYGNIISFSSHAKTTFHTQPKSCKEVVKYYRHISNSHIIHSISPLLCKIKSVALIINATLFIWQVWEGSEVEREARISHMWGLTYLTCISQLFFHVCLQMQCFMNSLTPLQDVVYINLKCSWTFQGIRNDRKNKDTSRVAGESDWSSFLIPCTVMVCDTNSTYSVCVLCDCVSLAYIFSW